MVPTDLFVGVLAVVLVWMDGRDVDYFAFVQGESTKSRLEAEVRATDVN
jgi:hypothetical protein